MGTAIFATANVIITDTSTRALVGASIALAFLLLLTVLFRRSQHVKDILFILVVGVILFTSTILLATALMHMQQTPYSNAEVYYI